MMLLSLLAPPAESHECQCAVHSSGSYNSVNDEESVTKATDMRITGPRLRQYVIAITAVAAALVLSVIIHHFVPRTDVWPLFLAALMFSAWRGGLGAGLLATAFSALVGLYFFLPPQYSLTVSANGLLELGVFVLAALVINSLTASRERALALEQQARCEAEAANAVKDEFLAAVSHELRTPLTTIKTLTHFLLRKNPAESERHEYLEDIASECDRQIDLVNNLLDLSRMKAGGLQIRLGRVNVAAAVQACVKTVRIELAERDQNLSVEIPPDLPCSLADHGALRRALCTVIENAIKYTPDGGHIRISAWRSDNGEIAIEISDNGRGILADDLPHIFDSFYRGHTPDGGGPSTDEQEIPGVGLGLYLARVLIEGMNGSIEVRSQPAVGSAFILKLPVCLDEIEPEHHESSTRVVTLTAKGEEGEA